LLVLFGIWIWLQQCASNFGVLFECPVWIVFQQQVPFLLSHLDQDEVGIRIF
jgi:hypothetical protein